jgi:hypothetical protein
MHAKQPTTACRDVSSRRDFSVVTMDLRNGVMRHSENDDVPTSILTNAFFPVG